MTQTLRPNSDVTATNFASGADTYTLIDESSPSDLDRIVTDGFLTHTTTCTFECGMSTPPLTPAVGTSTIRYRGCSNESGGFQASLTVYVYEGATLRATGTTDTLPYNSTFDTDGTWTAFSFTADLSAITDWSNVRLRFVFTVNASISHPAQAGVSWAELEVPNPASGGIMLMFQ